MNPEWEQDDCNKDVHPSSWDDLLIGTATKCHTTSVPFQLPIRKALAAMADTANEMTPKHSADAATAGPASVRKSLSSSSIDAIVACD